jgi:hypothetical protein
MSDTPRFRVYLAVDCPARISCIGTFRDADAVIKALGDRRFSEGLRDRVRATMRVPWTEWEAGDSAFLDDILIVRER